MPVAHTKSGCSQLGGGFVKRGVFHDETSAGRRRLVGEQIESS